MGGRASLCLERETGIEPATNGLGSRYSTIELLPRLAQYKPAYAGLEAAQRVVEEITLRPGW